MGNPPIFLLGEAKGANEAKVDRGFVGSSGIELLKMLDEAKIIELTSEDRDYIFRYYNNGDPLLIDCVWQMHPEVFRSNVFQQHPPGNRLEHFCGDKSDAIRGYSKLGSIGYIRQEFQHELDRLGNELLEYNPNLVICLGNSALWALSGRTGVTKLRGTTSTSTHCVDGFKLLPTYHPAAVLRQWDLRPVTVIDLMKAKREAEYPEIRRPKREIWIEPTLIDLQTFYEQHIVGCRYLAVDIENPGGPISEVGLGHASAAIVIPFVDARKKDRSYWRTKDEEIKAVRFLKDILEDPTIKKVMQNGLHDVSAMMRYWGIMTRGFEQDDMLLHHALQPESLKGLGFLGATYTSESSWKGMRKFTSIKRDD